MAYSVRRELVRRELADNGHDLDELVREARSEGLGWRLVTRRIESAGGASAPDFTTVRRWFEAERSVA